jgi:hypothetical protein
MNQHRPGNETLVVIHAYKGDEHQVKALMPVFEHHRLPIVIITPWDAPIKTMGPHICREAGQVAYIGQKSWDRQYLQLKTLLDYPHQWFLCNDSDSFVLPADLPEFLFKDKNTVWSNEVDDFRVPGGTWPGVSEPWPMDYHKGLPLIAMQPPYFFHRNVLEKIVKTCEGLQACPITPFIDWWWVPACDKAHVKHARYPGCASCENVTEMGKAVMRQCVTERGAVFIHSVKTKEVMEDLVRIYKRLHP